MYVEDSYLNGEKTGLKESEKLIELLGPEKTHPAGPVFAPM